MKKKFDIIGFGLAFVENIALLKDSPAPNATIKILKSQKQIGGSAAKLSIFLSVLGAKTAFIGKVGDDENGDFIKNSFFDSDVSSSNMISEQGKTTPFSQVWIDSKTDSRQTAHSKGSLTPLQIYNFDLEKLPSAKFLHFDGHNQEISIEIAKFYKQLGSYISVDTSNLDPDNVDLLYWADIIMTTKDFAANFFKDDTRQNLVLTAKKHFKNAKLIVLTDATFGTICIFRDKIFTQKSFIINKRGDTSAFDIHAAGILFGLLKNWKIEDTLEFAAAAYAIKCANIYNIDSPNFSEIKNFIKETRTCNNFEILN